MTKPLFQRRHYEFIAAVLRQTSSTNIDAFIEALKLDNPMFKEEKFRKAVGVN